MPAPSLNTTLQGLADVIGPATGVSTYTVPQGISLATRFPRIELYPWKYRAIEVMSGQRGNHVTGGQASGANRYLALVLQAPYTQDLNVPAAVTALYDTVDALIDAFTGTARQLVDDANNERALDAGMAIEADFGHGGPYVKWGAGQYVGVYIAIDVDELWRP